MNLKRLKKRYFDDGNVLVFGLRGRGKDILFGNILARSKKQYISNVDYTNDSRYHLLKMDLMDCGKNTWKDFIDDNIKFYEWQYPQGADIYISDGGIYFPSHFNNEINKRYPYFPTYMALSRQVSNNNVHVNVQNLNRLWDKIREQSDYYIECCRCIYILGFVFLKIRIYDKYDSAVSRVKPPRIKVPLFANKEVKQQSRMYLDTFTNTHGLIKQRFLFFKNKSKHDTYYFKKLLKEGVKKID